MLVEKARGYGDTTQRSPEFAAMTFEHEFYIFLSHYDISLASAIAALEEKILQALDLRYLSLQSKSKDRLSPSLHQ